MNLNLQDLLERTAGDAELADELLALFREEAESLLSEVRNAVLSHNGEALARAAHTLTGSAASIGAETVHQIARELERSGRAGTGADAAEALDQLDTALARVVAAINDRIGPDVDPG